MPKQTTKAKKSRKSRKSKSKTKETEEVVAAAAPEVVEEVAVEEVAVEEVATEESAPVEESTTTEETNTENNTQSNSVVVVDEPTLLDLFNEVDEIDSEIHNLTQKRKQKIKLMKRRAKILTKENVKLSTTKSKKKGGKKRPNHNSGIMRPHPVSKKLAKFMEHAISVAPAVLTTEYEEDGKTVKSQTLMEVMPEYSRVHVLKAISAYVKKMELQDKTPGQGKYINLDKELKKIFPALKKAKGDDRLRYTLIMKHIKDHFPTTQSAAASSS